MIVKAIEDSFENAPEELINSGYSRESKIQNVITLGVEYEVQAIIVNRSGNVLFCVIVLSSGKRGHPHNKWLPAWLFTVTDPTMPSDWECRTFWHNDSYRLILGPAFLSKSPDAIKRFDDLEPYENNLFWERAKRLGNIGIEQ